MKRITWTIVLASCAATLCLAGWAVVELIRWAGSLVGCV